MNVDTFLGNFATVVNAPKGLDQVRSLILRLAIQGRLVPPGREDASELLRELREIRNVATSKKKRGAAALPTRVPNELGFQIPQHWRWAQFGELGNWGAGATPNRADKSYYGGKMPWYKSGELNDGVLDTAEEFITEKALKACSLRINEPGDVLVAMYGATIGKVGIASVQCTTNQAVCACTPFEGVFNRYLLILLKAMKPWFIANAAGAAQPNYSKDKIIRTSAPLPPLEEQKRIVAKVDELMRLCDRLEAQQQEREKLLPLLSRANHTRFVTEPTDENLRAIFHESGAASPEELRTTILTLAVKGTLVPSEHLPVVGSLNSTLAEPSSNGVSIGPTKDTGATEILRISAGTSRSDFFVDEEDFKHVDLPHKEIEKHRLKTADLLACRFNGNLRFVGRFSFYRGQSGRVQVNPDKLIRFRVDTTKHCPRYVCFAMNADPTRKAVEALCATTAGNIGLSAGKLKNVELPLPELEQQRRIAERVTQLMEIVDRLESEHKQASVFAESFAKAAVATITSTEFTESERMKPPKTEVVTALKVGRKPKKPDAAPLARLLSEQKAEASAKTLWQLSGLEIDAFYRQLKTEMANGWIEEPHRAFVREQFDLWQKINELKGRLGWEEVTGSIREWWESFEQENRHRPELLLRLLERLALKKLTIASFLKKYTFQTQDIQTVYNDIIWLQKEEIDSLLMDEAESET
jgi:type I restriction enzyme S subunit